MVKNSSCRLAALNLAMIFWGMAVLLFPGSEAFRACYVIMITAVLVLSIFWKRKDYIRPYSYLVLSFLVFVWMRYLLNLFFNTDVISVGNGINAVNLSHTAVYLGTAANVICMVSILMEGSRFWERVPLFESRKRMVIPGYAEGILVVCALGFFALFLLDSVRKISVINAHDYLAVSENIMVQGYRYFSFGKYFILLWILFGSYRDRFFWGSTILMLAGVGYLMRGARGYAIMYIFMWLLFFSFRHRIKWSWMIILGMGLVYLANFILSYRLGWSVASGFRDVMVSTLNSQGASVDPVFGSVVFREEIRREFGLLEIFTRNDFGMVVDRVRGTGFESGGFGSSFFAEAYFMGFPLGMVFTVLAGVCTGILECACRAVKKGGSAEYAQMLLFMTLPNLIYLGRSSLKDFIFKTIITVIILWTLQSVAGHSCRGSRQEGVL